MRIKFIKNGKFTGLSEALLIGIVLLGFFGIPIFNIPLWLAVPLGIVAVIAAGLLIFEGAAVSIGLSPFSNDPLGWRKAKKTYENDDDDSSQER